MTESGAEDSAVYAELQNLIGLVRENAESGIGALRETMAGRLRWFLRRLLQPADVEAALGEALDLTIEGVRAGRVSTPAELASYARRAAHTVAQRTAKPGQPSLAEPTSSALNRMKEVLAALSKREREAILRFYGGENASRVCSDLSLSAAEFVALKQKVRRALEEPSPDSIGAAARLDARTT